MEEDAAKLCTRRERRIAGSQYSVVDFTVAAAACEIVTSRHHSPAARASFLMQLRATIIELRRE